MVGAEQGVCPGAPPEAVNPAAGPSEASYSQRAASFCLLALRLFLGPVVSSCAAAPWLPVAALPARLCPLPGSWGPSDLTPSKKGFCGSLPGWGGGGGCQHLRTHSILPDPASFKL